ncbi:unnamed protein product [Rhizophagus irregularis]|nr:unnamed protein product [Rhizophagus irregularis]
MPSELESLKQRITELEAKNDKLEAENAELRKENTEIHDLRIKLSISDAEIAQLKRMNAETLRANGEYNERRDAKEKKLEAKIKEMESEFRDRFTKVEQKQSLIDNSSNNTSSNFNLVAEPTVTQHEKPLVDEEMDTSLPEEPILEGLTETISPPIPPAPQVLHVPIKISKFPEDRNIIYEAVRKRFPFLSWTKSITKYRDHFEYTNSEAKCPACTSIHTHRGIWGDWTCQSKDNFYYLMCPWDIHQNKKVKIATQLTQTMTRKKNKRHNQSTSSATSSSANETQSKNMIVTDTELRELVRQGLIVDEVHELENQCDDPREKAYHALMRGLFGMKAVS